MFDNSHSHTHTEAQLHPLYRLCPLCNKPFVRPVVSPWTALKESSANKAFLQDTVSTNISRAKCASAGSPMPGTGSLAKLLILSKGFDFTASQDNEMATQCSTYLQTVESEKLKLFCPFQAHQFDMRVTAGFECLADVQIMNDV